MRRLAGQFLMSLALVLSVAATPRAQDLLRAAAVVNDEIVSMLDVDMRLRLTILSSGLKDTPKLRQRMMSQIMRTLIDERLQAQEAARLDIKITDAQIENAIARLASQNKMAPEAFLQLLENRGVLKQALSDQVRAQLLWQALLARRIRPSIQVSDEEVDEIIARIRATQGATVRQIAEIFLSIDNPDRADQVRRNAERIFEQLRGGAKFAALARQFSESATAARGGDIGWVQEGQLPEEIDKTLAAMKPGSLSPPIRTLDGYHIVWLRDQRQRAAGQVTLDLKQILFALPSGATAAQKSAAAAQAAQVRDRIKGCEGFDEIARTVGSPGSGDLGTVKLNDLPDIVRATVADLPIGQPSASVTLPNGLSILMVCDRVDSGIDRERIVKQLMDERINIQSRRFMRDLRRNANVDIRI